MRPIDSRRCWRLTWKKLPKELEACVCCQTFEKQFFESFTNSLALSKLSKAGG
jgi:hypothetical protein